MKRVCAWCQLVIEPASKGSDRVTHGICPACFDSLMAKVGAASEERKNGDGKAMEIKS